MSAVRDMTKQRNPRPWTLKDDCDCGLCQPVAGRRYDPEWGFDLDKVKEVHCIHCNKPIGDAPYKLDLMLARFGTMSFLHERCTK